uniref:G-protein coupled receptors family 1 profile domain-containing protein n=1 Tax=Chinchilla lanigera TaxID=34839 RepID=A0A8C2V034_CHILA
MERLSPDLDVYKIHLKNLNDITVFILLGFTDDLDLQIVLFFPTGYWRCAASQPNVLFPECVIILGCLLLYCCPKLLINFLAENKSISRALCVAQMLLFVSFGSAESFLLAAMAYDSYVAIYNPLLYSVTLSPKVCVILMISSYVGGFSHATVHTVATFTLSFCGSNEIRHVFCDIPPLLAISCSDTHTNQLLLFYLVGAIEVVTILIVLITYGFILLAVLKGSSVFSTCGSHLARVSIYHGTILFTYVRPSFSYALEHDMVVPAFCTTVIPMLNPTTYSLRNKDGKQAMQRLFSRYCFV